MPRSIDGLKSFCIDEWMGRNLARLLFSAVTCLLAGLPESGEAALIQRSVVVNVNSGAFAVWGNSGMTFEYEAPVTSFDLRAGDVLSTRVTFDKPIDITDLGDGNWMVGNYASREQVVLRYCLADTNARSDSGYFTSDVTFYAAGGGLNVATSRVEISSSGKCSEMLWVFVDDLTQSSFVLLGFDVTTVVNSLEFSSDINPTFASVFVGLAAGALSVSDCSPFPGGGNTGGCFPGPGPFPAPEPGTLALLGLGLAGLAFTRRRKQ